MANRWLQHLAQYRKVNKDMNPKELMKNARKSYQSGGEKGPLHIPVKSIAHSVNKTVNSIAKKGGGVTPYVRPTNMGSPIVKGAPDVINIRGGGVVPFEPTGTNSTPARVGGRRSRRQSSRKSRRTRRR